MTDAGDVRPVNALEQFVVELAQPLGDPIAPPDIPKLVETVASYGIEIHGSLPDEPEMREPSANGNRAAAHVDSDLKALNRRWIVAFNERDGASGEKRGLSCDSDGRA